MIYCQEPRRVQFRLFQDALYVRSDGRVVESSIDGKEAQYLIKKGRMKVKTKDGNVDLAKLVVWSFTGYRPNASAIGFRDGDRTNCRLGNLIVFDADEARRKPNQIEVVKDGQRKVYFSINEASYCEMMSENQIAYILKSGSESTMRQRCKPYGIDSVRRFKP